MPDLVALGNQQIPYTKRRYAPTLICSSNFGGDFQLERGKVGLAYVIARYPEVGRGCACAGWSLQPNFSTPCSSPLNSLASSREITCSRPPGARWNRHVGIARPGNASQRYPGKLTVDWIFLSTVKSRCYTSGEQILMFLHSIPRARAWCTTPGTSSLDPRGMAVGCPGGSWRQPNKANTVPLLWLRPKS